LAVLAAVALGGSSAPAAATPGAGAQAPAAERIRGGDDAAQARPMSVDDYLQIRMIGEVEVSPANDLVAVSVSRASEPGDNYRSPSLAEASIPARHDLVVISALDGKEVFRSGGREAGESAFSPVWSPDGGALAFLRADRSGRLSLWVWRQGAGDPRKLAEDVRAETAVVGPDRPQGRPHALAWLSNGEILFTAAGSTGAAPDPAHAREQAARGEGSGRIWRSDAVPLCRPADRLAVIRLSDRSVRPVLSGAILGATLAPGGQSMAVMSGLEPLRPPADRPLGFAPRPLRAGDGVPALRWTLTSLVRRGDQWRPLDARVVTGAVTSDALARWDAAHRRWLYLDVPDPYGLEPAARVGSLGGPGADAPLKSFATRPDALAYLARSGPAAPGPDKAAAAAGARIGSGAAPLGATASGIHIFRKRTDDGVTTLWAVDGRRASVLLEVNAHLRRVRSPEPVAVRYAVDGEPRTGWLFLPDGVTHPPVLVTAYPLSRSIPSAALPPEGTFPAVTELLARGVAVYVADLRLRNAAPVPDEPGARILSEMGAGLAALKATGRVDGGRAVFLGHSFGGYVALTLLAHSHDYRGIVAMAPLGDLLGYAFRPAPNQDQSCGPAQVVGKQIAHEYPGSSELPPSNNLLMKLGAPPYLALAKYLRNSPLLDIKEAETPALLIQGSEDGFSDGERAFNTLYRLGTDVELLYYWGEGHVISGPANVRDMTERTVRWALARLERPEDTPQPH
jgi:dipeptidyl aminopeptidase/acylaminoacyl peptidase